MIPAPSIEQVLQVKSNDTEKLLKLQFDEVPNVELGQKVAKAVTQTTPTISFTGAKPDVTYILVKVDLDAPTTSLSFLSPLLHWIQPNVRLSSTDAQGTLQYSGEPAIVDLIGANPPPFSAPHRYLFLLYEQPSSFDVQSLALAPGGKVGLWSRLRFDLQDWEKRHQVGPVVAHSYYVADSK